MQTSVSTTEREKTVLTARVNALTATDLAAIAAFEGGEAFKEVLIRFPGCALKDVAVLQHGAQNPPFTSIVEGSVPVSPLFTGPGFWCIVNEQSPFPESYPGRARDADNPASGSLFHLLLVPTSRIYNAVSLKPAHLALLHAMRARAQEELGSGFPPALISNTREALVRKLRRLNVPDDDVANWVTEFDTRLSSFTAGGEAVQWGFFFHVHPDHTVGHLHLHCIPMNASLRTNLVHDAKAVPWDAVVSSLQ
jgi:Scavenger mRNA decapping enzyme C-term binding